MPQVTGTSTYWNSPNYEGMLFTAQQIPGQGAMSSFLTVMGGLNAENMRVVSDFDFAMANEYDFPAPAQPAIDENASLTAPSAVSPIDSQTRNTVQIYQEAVSVSYKKYSTQSRLATDIVVGTTGYWAPEGTPLEDAIARRKVYILNKIARDFNYTCLNGTYQMSTASDVAAKTRGIKEAVVTNAIDASGAELSEALLQELFASVAENSAKQAFSAVPILIVPTVQKQNITKIYGNQPDSWNIGGINVETIMTDFGLVGLLYDPMVNASADTTDSIVLASMAACKPVFCPVATEKQGGLLIYEELSKTGASINGQFYGQMGLDYSHEKMHGKITGISRTRI
jgi:hypothetical protein